MILLDCLLQLVRYIFYSPLPVPPFSPPFCFGPTNCRKKCIDKHLFCIFLHFLSFNKRSLGSLEHSAIVVVVVVVVIVVVIVIVIVVVIVVVVVVVDDDSSGVIDTQEEEQKGLNF